MTSSLHLAACYPARPDWVDAEQSPLGATLIWEQEGLPNVHGCRSTESVHSLSVTKYLGGWLVVHAWGRWHLSARREVYCGPSRDDAATRATEIAMAAGWGEP